jgi:hypothetical protein
MKSLGPFPKSSSGPANTYAQIILPFPTGLSALASISMVSVSQACILHRAFFKISIALRASSLERIIVVPSILRFLMAKFTPNYLTFSFDDKL